jgi:hypothetical protein
MRYRLKLFILKFGIEEFSYNLNVHKHENILCWDFKFFCCFMLFYVFNYYNLVK